MGNPLAKTIHSIRPSLASKVAKPQMTNGQTTRSALAARDNKAGWAAMAREADRTATVNRAWTLAPSLMMKKTVG